MKTRSILTLAIMFITLISFGQTRFDKFADNDGVKVVTVNQMAFKLMSNIKGHDKESDEVIEMIKNLDNLQMFITEDKLIGDEMKVEVGKYLKSNKLSELVKVKDGDNKVNVYIKSGKNVSHITQLFMFVQEKQNSIVIMINGNIDLAKISELVQKLNIPHSDKLK